MAVQSSSDAIVRRIKAEYLEMPGLKLTEEQAERLWNLSRPMCEGFLEALVDSHFLLRTRDGAFVRADTRVH